MFYNYYFTTHSNITFLNPKCEGQDERKKKKALKLCVDEQWQTGKE